MDIYNFYVSKPVHVQLIQKLGPQNSSTHAHPASLLSRAFIRWLLLPHVIDLSDYHLPKCVVFLSLFFECRSIQRPFQKMAINKTKSTINKNKNNHANPIFSSFKNQAIKQIPIWGSTKDSSLGTNIAYITFQKAHQRNKPITIKWTINWSLFQGFKKIQAIMQNGPSSIYNFSNISSFIQ